MRAFDAVEARDPERLAELLDRSPELVGMRGTNGNDLLGMAGATGDPRLVQLLLERGADPARGNAHGWTPLHQAAYSGRVDLAELLLAAGAPTDTYARGDGGTPLVIALFWGHPVPPALVERVGLAPGNLRVAAGLGLIEHDRRAGRARRHARPRRRGAPRLLPAARRLPVLAADRRPAGGAGRGPLVGRARRPRRGGRRARRARRETSRPTSTAARR